MVKMANGTSLIEEREVLFNSLKRNLNALFTFENFPADQVPRTNNAIESLNSVLKMRLRLHRGLSKERRELLIGNILGAYNPDKH